MKVVKVKMTKLHNGKVEFEKLEQTHVILDDRTANVNTVTCAIQSKWGSEYSVVTGDGLEVDDWPGIQGTWYSIPLHEINIGYSNSPTIIQVSKIKYCHVNHSCTTTGKFWRVPTRKFYAIITLNLNVKEKEKRESNLTLLLIVVLTQMIDMSTACLLMKHRAPS